MAHKKSYQAVLELSREYFEQYPDADSCLACTDGNIFHAEKADLARLHAKDAGCATHSITRVQAFPVVDEEQPGDDNEQEPEKQPGEQPEEQPAPRKATRKKRPAKKPVVATPEDRSPDDDE